MISKRKTYEAQDKVAILRLHLLEGKPVSDLCDQFGPRRDPCRAQP